MKSYYSKRTTASTKLGNVILIGVFVLIGIAPLSSDGLQDGKILLERATLGLFNETLPHYTLRELLDGSLKAFAELKEPCERDYWRAQVSYLYGFVEQGDGREKEAERRFTQGFELAESALSCGEFSDGYRLLADTQAQLLMHNGTLYKMQYGPTVREFAEKALELDPGNIKARLNLALYYKNAPAIAGGSEKTAREILHQIEGMSGLELLDRFSVNVWLGISYAESKNAATARRYIDQAQDIFPGNTWLQEIVTEPYVHRFPSPNHYPAFLPREYGLIESVQKRLLLLLEPLDTLKGLVIYPKDPVGHEESLGTLISEKLAANAQRQQIHLAAV
jgi:tetratricopeptide (TPR) repeat protein